jgi:hypothetical protein
VLFGLIIADKIIKIINSKRNKEKEEDKCKDNKQNYKIKNNVKNRIYKILRKAIIYIRDTIIMTTTVQIIIVRNTCI